MNQRISLTQQVCVLLVGLLISNIYALAQKSDLKSKAAPSDSLNQIKKYKIKAVTTTTFVSEDSTFKKETVEYKYKIIYDKNGNAVESFTENKNGKKIQRTEAKFDTENKLIESIAYDSTNTISYSTKTKYDMNGNVTESVSSTQISAYTLNPEDANKYVVYTNRNRFDVNNNLVEYTTDSAETTISKVLQQYDDKNRLLTMTVFTKGFITSKEITVYDSKGAKTVTTEMFELVNPNQCGPTKNKTVQKFDSKGNLISYITTSDDNGSIITTKTTSEYKYDKELITYVKTISETSGEGYTSKTINTETYKYDTKGNLLESSMKYGGGGGNSITKNSYNEKNELIESTVFYGSCNDKPVSITKYKYASDGTTMLESVSETFDYPSKSILKNDSRGLNIEDIYISGRDCTRSVYDYEYWN